MTTEDTTLLDGKDLSLRHLVAGDVMNTVGRKADVMLAVSVVWRT